MSWTTVDNLSPDATSFVVAGEHAFRPVAEAASLPAETSVYEAVTFPSGLVLSLVDGRKDVFTVRPGESRVHLFGELDLPLTGFYSAMAIAADAAAQCGYLVRRAQGDTAIDAYGSGHEAYRAIYRDDRLFDVVRLSA